MKYELSYGRGTIAVDLPDKNVVKVLEIRGGVPLADPELEVAERIAKPSGSPPLAELARGKTSACIVISDITRPVPNRTILPPILRVLGEAGIADSDIVILVATGLHRASTPEEHLEMLGEEIVARYRIVDHDARNRSDHEYLGESPRGVPIRVNRLYLQADLKITTGLIEPHLMAGFSGGRKAICPGIMDAETIGVWHSPRFLEHENAKPGCLENNPVHEEQLAIARKIGCDFIVNVVIDHRREILHVVAGDMEKAHREGVDRARTCMLDTVDRPVDVIVTSCAGYPLDTTFYQAIKGVVGAVEILKPGGTIILAASCSEGLGSEEFKDIAKTFPTAKQFVDAIVGGEYFIVNQWQLEELAKALRKGKVKIVSDGLPAEELRKYYVTPYTDLQEAADEALAEYGPDATIAVIPDGPYVLVEIR